MQTDIRKNLKVPKGNPVKGGIYSRFLKRSIDFILSVISIILFSPIMLILAILLRITIGSPVIFKHQRPGFNEKLFILYKFRTMTDERDEKGKLLPDEMRITKFGSLLRATSLDELPELINILKNDMSFVGPRPLETYFLPYYNEKEKHRHDVKPGLTGLAQVKGRNNLTWEQRFEYDLIYVNQITLFTDIMIVFLTIIKVLKSEGIDSDIEDFNISRKNQRKER